MVKPSSKIFISYRRDDSRHVSRLIHDRLAQVYGEEAVAFDVNDYPAGVDYQAHGQALIESSEVVLVVIGASWLEATDAKGRRRLDVANDPVRHEVEAALKSSARVLPIFVDGAKAPSEEQLPESIRALSRQNGLPVRPDNDFDTDLSRLLEQVSKLVSGGSEVGEDPGAMLPFWEVPWGRWFEEPVPQLLLLSVLGAYYDKGITEPLHWFALLIPFGIVFYAQYALLSFRHAWGRYKLGVIRSLELAPALGGVLLAWGFLLFIGGSVAYQHLQAYDDVPEAWHGVYDRVTGDSPDDAYILVLDKEKGGTIWGRSCTAEFELDYRGAYEEQPPRISLTMAAKRADPSRADLSSDFDACPDLAVGDWIGEVVRAEGDQEDRVDRLEVTWSGNIIGPHTTFGGETWTFARTAKMPSRWRGTYEPRGDDTPVEKKGWGLQSVTVEGDGAYGSVTWASGCSVDVRFAYADHTLWARIVSDDSATRKVSFQREGCLLEPDPTPWNFFVGDELARISLDEASEGEEGPRRATLTWGPGAPLQGQTVTLSGP